MRLAARYLAASAVGLCAAISLPALAGPDRPSLVSLDYCADQFVLALADHDQIIGLSPDADAAHSFLREKAKGLPKTSASTEEVLQQKPDLVLRTWRGGSG